MYVNVQIRQYWRRTGVWLKGHVVQCGDGSGLIVSCFALCEASLFNSRLLCEILLNAFKGCKSAHGLRYDSHDHVRRVGDQSQKRHSGKGHLGIKPRISQARDQYKDNEGDDGSEDPESIGYQITQSTQTALGQQEED